MELGNRLTGGSPVVEAEIESVRSRGQCLGQMFSGSVDPDHQAGLLGGGDVLKAYNRAPRDDQGVAG